MPMRYAEALPQQIWIQSSGGWPNETTAQTNKRTTLIRPEIRNNPVNYSSILFNYSRRKSETGRASSERCAAPWKRYRRAPMAVADWVTQTGPRRVFIRTGSAGNIRTTGSSRAPSSRSLQHYSHHFICLTQLNYQFIISFYYFFSLKLLDY